MKVEQARMSLLQKARARPDQVKKVLDTARTLGWKSALEKVRNRLESPTPLGYSAAGTVIAVDPLNTRFRVGDRVACGGAECAFHAETIAVPDLLAARIPDGVTDWQAAYTTLAAISMQAVRQSGAQLGDRVLVLGQGLVGLLATSLLRASGARVLAADYVQGRLQTALAMGAERVINPGQTSIAEAVRDWTDGDGVDAVLLCVGGKGSDAADVAIASLRDRGVMVIVGIYDAELSWKTAYMKDIQVRYSRSYGPGRYDPQYEWGGQDYPLGYVRWTENRQFEACLQLMKTGQLDLAPVTSRRAAFASAIDVYGDLMKPGNTDIGVVLEYARSPGMPSSTGILPVESEAGILPANHSGRMPERRLYVIGAGNFARTMLLPHLKGTLEFDTVVNATGLSARHVKEKFGFARAETEAAKVFEGAGSGSGGAVLIATRHHLHAPLVLQGLQAGRHVFVEKPLCLTPEELAEIDAAVAATGQGSVTVGFNRRFAPASVELQKVLKTVPGPKTLAFHVFAGPLAPDHWYANVAESGGRILGEACHFFDYACFLLGKPVRVMATTTGRQDVPDAVNAQIEFENGSSAQIIYSAQGDSSFPKESFRVFGAGVVAECENFQKLTIHRSRKRKAHAYASKGHAEEMQAWAAYLKGDGRAPLPYGEARQSMRLTFAVQESLRQGAAVTL